MGANPINGYLGDKASKMKMNGAAAPGVSLYSAREDHVHPSDTGKSDVNHTHAGMMFTKKIIIDAVDWVAAEAPATGFVATIPSGLNLGGVFDVLTFLPYDSAAAVVADKKVTFAGTSANDLLFNADALAAPGSQITGAFVYSR